MDFAAPSRFRLSSWRPEEFGRFGESSEENAMRLWASTMIVVCLTITAGCCATCRHSVYGVHGYGGPGAVYGEDMGVAVCHPGPLSWLWRLLGIGRGYPCDDCGPRYWGDWGGDIAGCEACDDFGQWTGMPTVSSRPAAVVPSHSGMRHAPCPECSSADSSTAGAKPLDGQTSLAAKPDEKTIPRR